MLNASRRGQLVCNSIVRVGYQLDRAGNNAWQWNDAVKGHRYDDTFFDYTANTSGPSARKIISILRQSCLITSVLDVGCARGTWLREWSRAGIASIHGVDGDYVKRNSLLVPPDTFTAVNLAEDFDLKCRFDLVQSLEVAEHLPQAVSRRFIETLINHSSGLVLFSAAVPGQGGEQHINEQPYEYWRALFRDFDYYPVDIVRPEVLGQKDVSYWYRYNTMLYVRGDSMAKLSVPARRHAVPIGQPIPDVSPRLYRLRKRIIRALPKWAVNGLSRMLAKVHSSAG